MSSPVLWQNARKTVTLIDVPCSIAAAQGLRHVTSRRHLLASPPLQASFAAKEPRSAAAKARIQNHSADADLHAEYHACLRQALEQVKSFHCGDWCHPRPFVQETARASEKRKIESDEDFVPESSRVMPSASVDLTASRSDMPLPIDLLTAFARKNDGEGFKYDLQSVFKDDLGSRDENDEKDKQSFSNENKQNMAQFVLSDKANELLFKFLVPPRSSFYLGDCSDSRSFHAAVRNQARRGNFQAHFDFIMLDPPWPNRSVQRARKTPGSGYITLSTVSDIRELILDTKADSLMAKECLVAIWITNKPTVRELVLGKDGIFDYWDVTLVEEWIWLKTTACGDPMNPVDSAWKKPYEVLLLGRRHEHNEEASSYREQVKRKVLISVPDQHSRKPCLKELIEPLLAEKNGYRALEIFARHLVEGWWSWGDECIKFNWEGYWSEPAN